MNWIKAQKGRRLLKKCFQDLMKCKSTASPKFFALGAESAARTYYQQRAATRLAKKDFEIGPFRQGENLAEALAAHWQKTDPSLVAFAKPCAQMADCFKQAEDASADVSAFVYVMY